MLQRLKAWSLRCRHQLAETGVCLALGLKDSLCWQLLWRGLLLSAALGLFWLVLFGVWHQDVLTLSLFLGGAGIYQYLLLFMQRVPGLGGYAILFPLLTAVLLAPFAAALLFPRVMACVGNRCQPVRSPQPPPI